MSSKIDLFKGLKLKGFWCFFCFNIFFSGCYFFAIKNDGKKLKKQEQILTGFPTKVMRDGDANLTRGGPALPKEPDLVYAVLS